MPPLAAVPAPTLLPRHSTLEVVIDMEEYELLRHIAVAVFIIFVFFFSSFLRWLPKTGFHA
jgi:hypothetical protein